MAVADEEHAAGAQQRDDLGGPPVKVVEPGDRPDTRVDDVEVADDGGPRIEDIGLHPRGLDAQTRRELTCRVKRRRREVDAGDPRAGASQ